MLSQTKKISIIIVTYQSEKDIYDCVASLLHYADIPLSQIEIIIVDNHSPNSQPMFDQLSQQFDFPFIFLQNTENGGYGQGNNIGIRHASAPIVMILNPDVRQTMGYLAQPLQHFEQDTDLIMYGMHQYLENGQKSHNSFACTTMMNGYLRVLLSAFANRLDWYMPRYMHFSGACFFVRKDMFTSVGLFDESNFMYGEEQDIHYRLAQRYGYHFLYNPHLHYIHCTQEREWTPAYEQKIIQATLRLNKKNGYARSKSIANLQQSYQLLRLRMRLRMWFQPSAQAEYAKYNEVLDYINQLAQ